MREVSEFKARLSEGVQRAGEAGAGVGARARMGVSARAGERARGPGREAGGSSLVRLVSAR